MNTKVTGMNRGPIQRIIFLLLSASMLSCGSNNDNASDAGNKERDVVIDVYNIRAAGLLIVEQMGKDSIHFDILVGAGERCTGATAGVGVLQADGSFQYGDSDCMINFIPTGAGMTVKESGDLCDHGAHCSFGGDYSKIASEKFQPASVDLMSWMRKSISDFSCMLETQYGHKLEAYPCGKKDTIDYDPAFPSWNFGPEFPEGKVKSIHPMIKTLSVQFEHGELYLLTVTLEEKMSWQSIQRMFNFTPPFNNYGQEERSNVMSLTYDDYQPESLIFDLNPIFVTSFTLQGFEHLGAGDGIEELGEVIDAETYYGYEEQEGKYVLVNEDGPGPYEFTCSGIATIKTSSVLSNQGATSYGKEHLTDMDESTTWVEGVEGLGIGESVEFTITDEYKKWGYTDEEFVSKALKGSFVIQTGYAKSPSLWKKNSRPVTLKCYLNWQPLSVIQLQDSPDFQIFNIFPKGTEPIPLKVGDIIRFDILDVVKGTSDEDACITEFHIEGSCG